MIRLHFAALSLLFLAGCATSQPQPQAAGKPAEHVISCAFFGWQVCYEKANQICNGRYKMLSHDEAFNRKDLRIRCLAAAD